MEKVRTEPPCAWRGERREVRGRVSIISMHACIIRDNCAWLTWLHGREAEGGLFLTGMASTLGWVATRQSLFQAVEQPQYGNVVTPPLSMPA